MRWWLAALVIAAGGAAAAGELVVTPGEPVAATIDGRPARLLVGSGRLDRLTLDPDYVAEHGIRPAVLAGRGELEVAGRREFKGHNRPMTLTVAGERRHARAFWFDGAPDSGVDGRIGPWGLPQARVTFALGPARGGEAVLRLTLRGSADEGSYAVIGLDGHGVGLAFDVEDAEPLPVATAAAGALIAASFGGALEGPSREVDILMGVRRPVRLLRLARPMTIGPLSFDRIAVRVPGAIDEGVVTGKADGRANYSLSIPRAALANCSRLTFDTGAKVIELVCRASRG